MNCKQGDLAIFVRGRDGSKSPNIGKIFTCIRLATKEEIEATFISDGRIVWITDTPIKWALGGNMCMVTDEAIRPLRGDLSNDEVDTETPIIRETEKC